MHFQLLKGSRTFEKYLINVIGWLITGCGVTLVIQSSLHKSKILNDLTFQKIILILILFTVTGIYFSTISTIEIIENRGSGYNLLDKKDSIIRIVRNDMYGKKIFLTYPINEIEYIKINIAKNFNRPRIYLIMKDKRRIPLYDLDPLMSLQQIEKYAINLANFLELPYLI